MIGDVGLDDPRAARRLELDGVGFRCTGGCWCRRCRWRSTGGVWRC